MKLNVVVTSGGTREYVDDVRVLTNISSGILGAKIAHMFSEHGHDVTYVAPMSAVNPVQQYGAMGIEVRYIKDTNSVMEVMKELVPKADVVIQAMAISDFTFDLTEAVKLSSGDPEAFIEHMRRTIKKTPKVIANFRAWNPDATLVGFKFTVGKSKEELSEIAKKLMKDNRLNMVFANDKAHMQKAGEHVGTLIMEDWEEKVRSKDEIVDSIYNNVIRIAPMKGRLR